MTNLGGQVFTFSFKQEGTGVTFNRILHKVLPVGILSMSNNERLEKISNSIVEIPPFRAMLQDTSTEVAVNMYTTSNVSITVTPATPYIVGTWTWMNTEDNYMAFTVKSFDDLSPTDIIFGKCEYNGTELEGFDYTRRTWSKDHYEGITSDFNFRVTSVEPSEGQVIPAGYGKIKVGIGKAYIGGKEVVFNSPVYSQNISLSVTNEKKILVSIDSSGNIQLTESADENDPATPDFPSNMLTVGIIDLPSNPTTLLGSFIEYVYNNNPVQQKTASLNENNQVPLAQLNLLLNTVYPVGCLYWSSDSTNPATLFGIGTWTQIKDTFIWAKGDSDTVNATGGAKTVILDVANLPSHDHTFTPSGSISGGSYTFTGTQKSTDNGGSWSFSAREHVISAGTNTSTSSSSTSNGIVGDGDAERKRLILTHSGHTHTYTPVGSISVSTNPTFSGTSDTTGSTGSGIAVDKMPPYTVKYCWERTA